MAKEAAVIDPEGDDARERQVSASLAKAGCGFAIAMPVCEEAEEAMSAAHNENARGMEPEALQPADPNCQPESVRGSDPNAWREEVAARLNSYRARRRPREPRYPSLQMKFEPAWSAFSASSAAPSHLILAGSAAAARVAHDGWPADQASVETSTPNPAAETTARVIPFRRYASAPPKPLEELAEPLQLFPRILEVAEVAPPAPALGGILIESAEEEPNPKRPGIEIPLQTSPISRRFLAAGIDGTVVASAFCLFAYIFVRITASNPPLTQAAGMGVVVLGILWAGYQYLLLTYAGATPGLQLTNLRLSRFDGSAVPRQVRRWRAFASILTALSLGLGYAWYMLDEDQLCWHDRITKTHLAPNP